MARQTTLRDLLDARGLSITAYAEAHGVSRVTAQRWVLGVQEPRSWQRPRIAEVLRVPLRRVDDAIGASVRAAALIDGARR